MLRVLGEEDIRAIIDTSRSLIQGMAVGNVAFAASAQREAVRLERGTTVDVP